MCIRRHHIPFTHVYADPRFADLSRIGPQKIRAVRGHAAHAVRAHTACIKNNLRFFSGLFRNNINYAADSIGAVFCTGRPLNHFNMIDIFRPDPHDFVHLSGIFRQIPHNGLAVYKNQRMPRFRASYGYAYTPHRIDSTRYARLCKNNIFYRFSLLLFNIFCRNNRYLLRIKFRFFFRCRSPYIYILRGNPGRRHLSRTRQRRRHPEKHRTGQHGSPCHLFLTPTGKNHPIPSLLLVKYAFFEYVYH